VVAYQRDYILRQVEMAAQMLARILGLASQGRGDQAIGLFDQAYQPLVGMSGRVVAALTEEQLLTLLTSGSSPDARRVAVAMELLVVEGDLHDQAGRAADAAARYRRALGLAAYLAGHTTSLPDPALAERLAARAAALDLPSRQRMDLCRLQEAVGRYADAEDSLFEVIDGDPDDGAAVDQGIAFYQRLLAKEDADLEAGGLPRDEVRAALAELLRR
jgi:tetratricopeptide (TPR) repeat protein